MIHTTLNGLEEYNGNMSSKYVPVLTRISLAHTNLRPKQVGKLFHTTGTSR